MRLSKLNTARFIHIIRPYTQTPMAQEMSVQSEIGWIFTSTCNTRVILPKKEFTFGEKCTVVFEINNFECSNDIKEVKVKLVRRFQTMNRLTGNVAMSMGYMEVFRWPGIASKT